MAKTRAPSNAIIACMLCLTVLFWGANNTGLKFLVKEWPPFWVISSRIWLVGGILAVLLRCTRWLGVAAIIPPGVGRVLWFRAGLSLAAYFATITYSLKFISAPQMALHLATSPVWGLVFELRPRASWTVVRKYAAACLALSGVLVVLWPKIQSGAFAWKGDLLAQIASMLWTLYGRECRGLSKDFSGAQITRQMAGPLRIVTCPHFQAVHADCAFPIYARLALATIYTPARALVCPSSYSVPALGLRDKHGIHAQPGRR